MYLKRIYKPILPHQVQQLLETKESTRLVDFVGQKVSFFFSDIHYAETLATKYAKELNEACLVLAFYPSIKKREHIQSYGMATEKCHIYGIDIENLDICFPTGWRQAKIVSSCEKNFTCRNLFPKSIITRHKFYLLKNQHFPINFFRKNVRRKNENL